MTLERLASLSGLTRSYLSKIERGLALPSAAAARMLAAALGMEADHFSNPERAGDPIRIRRARAGVPGDPQAHMSLIAGLDPDSAVRAYIVRPTRTAKWGRLMSDHAGEEILFVLSGSIELLIGKRREILNVGDCVSFGSTMPHRLTAASEEPASALLVIVSARGTD